KHISGDQTESQHGSNQAAVEAELVKDREQWWNNERDECNVNRDYVLAHNCHSQYTGHDEVLCRGHCLLAGIVHDRIRWIFLGINVACAACTDAAPGASTPSACSSKLGYFGLGCVNAGEQEIRQDLGQACRCHTHGKSAEQSVAQCDFRATAKTILEG